MTPRATYRLQFREGTSFDSAASLAEYLNRLGISHLYASPLFTATSGSTHGYDVTDHQQLDPVLGGEEGFERMSDALQAQRLGLILDIVPNHMAVSMENPWWADVLTWGRDSRYAGHFDIDWSAPKLLLPTLGEPYGEALEAGTFELRLDEESARLCFGYYQLAVPLTPPSYGMVLGSSPDLALLAEAARNSPPGDCRPLATAFREVLEDAARRAALQAALAEVTADRERLHRVHEAQIWRLAHWRLAREALTHRRFFEISDLIGVRVEEPDVFGDVHELTLRLVAEGKVDGLRIDHIDGLTYPKAYLARLRQAAGTDYIIVEKILSADEELRPDWEAAGTTGYEAARLITGLQVDPGQREAMTQAWIGFTGDDPDFARQVTGTKRRILTVNLAGELEALVTSAHRVALADLATRDFGRDALRRAVIEIAVALPVYRTYRDQQPPSDPDRALIEAAVDAANRGREVEDDREPDFIGSLLLGERPPTPDIERLGRRFQQTTGALTAKAVEDTMFYRFNRLIALNEVGAEPDEYGIEPQAFHTAMVERAATWPRALSSTATHDTKRGEDARARLAVLSEMPRDWAAAVRRWHVATGELREEQPTGLAPGPRAEWLFYQALTGAWPTDLSLDDEASLGDLAERLDAFMAKALREAKRRTSWTAQDEEFEAAVSRYVRAVFSPDYRPLLEDIEETIAPVIAAGFVNSLAQLTLKLTMPGVPDIYQGTELLDLSLVDPDNRRPVDFALRQRLLDEVREMSGSAAMQRWREGVPKMWLLCRLLDLRRRRMELFAHGSYRPLKVEGSDSPHVLAYARQIEAESVIVVVPRLVLQHMKAPDAPLLDPAALADAHVELPAAARSWSVVAGGLPAKGRRLVSAAELLGQFPIAVFESG